MILECHTASGTKQIEHIAMNLSFVCDFQVLSVCTHRVAAKIMRRPWASEGFFPGGNSGIFLG